MHIYSNVGKGWGRKRKEKEEKYTMHTWLLLFFYYYYIFNSFTCMAQACRTNAESPPLCARTLFFYLYFLRPPPPPPSSLDTYSAIGTYIILLFAGKIVIFFLFFKIIFILAVYARIGVYKYTLFCLCILNYARLSYSAPYCYILSL